MPFLLTIWAFIKAVPKQVWLGILGILIILGTIYSCSERKEQEVRTEIAEKDAATVIATRAVDHKVAEQHYDRIITIREKAAADAAKTEVILEQNADWANQPVPAAVLDSLR